MSATTHWLASFLLNALWQSILLCAAAWLVARVVRPLGPTAEHRVWVGALLLQSVVPACAVPGLLGWLRSLLDASGAHHGAVTVTLGDVKPLSQGISVATFVPYAVGAWAVLMLMSGLRLLVQLRQLGKLRRCADAVSLDGPTASWLAQQCAFTKAQGLAILASTAVKTPVTFGLRRPVLLLPRGFAEGVPRNQIRAALAHELAHVVRRDAAKQLLYRVAALPLAWHPAVRWTLTQIAETRERVCDSIAAEMTGGARQYARSLLELASLLTAQRPAYANAIGLFDANQLERRVLMLNRRVFPVARSLRVGLIAGSSALAVAACTSALALHLDAPSQLTSVSSDQTKPAGAVRIAPSVAAAQVVHKVQPVYPPEAKQAKIQGAVILKATIGKDGSIQNLEVVSGPAELQASAMDAVRQWVYRPYLLNGEPTAVETTITINYSLGVEASPQAALSGQAN